MYIGDNINVKLRFHKKLANVVMDRFGSEVMLIPEPDGEHFVFIVNVAVSPMFLSWVMGFGNLAQILHPQSAIDACKELCAQIYSQY